MVTQIQLKHLELIIVLSAVLRKFSDLAVMSALLVVNAARFNANPGGINGKDI